MHGNQDVAAQSVPHSSIDHSSNHPHPLTIEPYFCPADTDPFDTVEWETRTAQIKDETGGLIFEQTDCQIPKDWSPLATNVVVSKYFYGEPGTDEREKSVAQVINRVARTIADWGIEDGYFASRDDGENFYKELAWLCLHQHGAFNSPVWFNVGLFHQYGVKGSQGNYHWDTKNNVIHRPETPYEYPQASACFIQSVEDNMEDIMRLATSEAMLFKFGSGTGTDLSTIRSAQEKLSGGGVPSGPLSFMRVYDQIAAVVKSGGKTRRAAKMQSLKDWHPDILDFIQSKAKEERKARTLIDSGEYEANFNGEAYSSIMFQNANLSVRVSDEFMQAVVDGKKWTTRHVTNPQEKGPEYDARYLLKEMAQGTWYCGDPGVQYETTINKWHTCKNSGPINASNPCVTGDTLVATSEGLRRIDEMVGETPQVVGLDGNLHPTARVIPTGIKPVYRLRTRSGYELKLTADHRVWTVNRGDVPAGELTKNDELQLTRITFGRKHVSEIVCEQIGTSLANGETNVRRHLEQSLKQSMHSVQSESGAVTVLDADCEDLMALDATSIGAIIRAYYKAQGSPRHRVVNWPAEYAQLQHCSEKVLSQIQLLLLGFGIKSSLRRDCDPLFILDILPPFYQRFIQLVEGQLPKVSVESVETDKVDLDSWECLGEEPVYDLTEPVTSHFVANGIAVHNCSEYMFLDDTACNLASINLKKCMNEDGTFNVDRFRRACAIFITAQEILVDHASYPTPAIAENSHRFRPLGLGYANLGSLLMSMGIPYDSDAGRGICGALTAILNGQGYLTSSEIAGQMGPFKGFEENREPMLGVMRMHQAAVENIDPACPHDLKQAAREVWAECVAGGEAHGYRNAQATVLAPTGTIAFMMDCDTTGIEPDIALVKYKQLAGGGMMKIVNRTVPKALEKLNYDQLTIGKILKFIEDHDTIEGAPGFKDEHLPVFDCAFTPRNGTRSIAWKAHIAMMAAAQPFLSGAISKTVNMPEKSTLEDIEEAYLEGWRLGLKALAIYRDGSKQSQPLATSKESDRKKKEAVVDFESARKLVRRRLPATRQSLTHKFSVGGHEGYTTVGLFEDGSPGELFITMAKEGSTIGGLMDVIGTLTSMALQYGVPLEVIVNKFAHMRFEPSGWTSNPDIPNAKSVVDYIFRWLGIQFLPGYREANTPNRDVTPADVPDTPEAVRKHVEDFIGRQVNGSAAPTNGSANGHSAGGHSNGNAGGEATGTAAGSSPASATLEPAEGPGVRSEQFARFQSDAPACDNCGAITVRNGNCYLCHNCGNSMGCS